MQQTKIVHWALGLALVMILIFVVSSLVLVSTNADDVTTSAIVPNSTPAISSVYVSDTAYALEDDYPSGTITGLVGGSVKRVYINGVVMDLNGSEDISSVSISFYRSNHASTYECGTDANDCYADNSGSGCTIDTDYGDSTQAKFNCPFDLQYYVDSTDADSDNYSDTHWTVYVRVDDDNNAYSFDSSVTKDIESFVSLNIPSSIDFGTMALGATTTDSNNVALTIEQYGNLAADLEVQGSALTCSVNGTIPVGNMEWATTDVGYGSTFSYDMTTDAYDTDFNIGLRSTTSVTKPMYWNIQIPDSGVEGECTGTTVLTAKAHD